MCPSRCLNSADRLIEPVQVAQSLDVDVYDKMVFDGWGFAHRRRTSLCCLVFSTSLVRKNVSQPAHDVAMYGEILNQNETETSLEMKGIKVPGNHTIVLLPPICITTPIFTRHLALFCFLIFFNEKDLGLVSP